MSKYTVISSDCHAGLPMARYRDYVDPKYRELMDQSVPVELDMADRASKSFLIKDINDEWRAECGEGLSGAWDYEQRLKVLDGDGVAVEVVFPDGVTEHNSPPFGAGLGLPAREDIVPDLQWAGARAHNRWLAEFLSPQPERHIGIASIPLLWDVEQGVAEARWAHENGLRGVMLPNLTYDHPGYHHTRYHPFWEACQDLGLIVHFHSGGAPHANFFGPKWPEETSPDYVGAMGIYVSEVVFWTFRPLTFIIWGGVFEKFPKLKVVVTETGTCWTLPSWISLLDHNYSDVEFARKLGNFHSHLSMAPSEYFRRNVAIGASCILRRDVDVRHEIGMPQLMWGTDYPHPEGAWPHSRKQMVDTFRGLPDDEIAAFLGENAVRFYGLDRDAIAPIVERIGPSKEEFQAAA